MIVDLQNFQTKLQFFQNLYSDAKAKGDVIFEQMRKNLDQYKGSSEIDRKNNENIAPKDATQIRNITYELIESQVSSYIPTASVRPKKWSEENERCAKSVETLLSNKRDELPFEKMNDMDERYNPIYGGSVWLVEWDNSIRTHDTVGDIKVSCLSPMHFVGQPNIYEIQEMEYCFIFFETTKDDICRKYGVTRAVADKTENTENKGEDDSTATLIVCYYKNDKDKICQYVWSGEEELLDIDDYYSRKHRVCNKCGKREEFCTCKTKKKNQYEYENEEYEELDFPITLSNGTEIPVLSPVIKDGVPQYDMVEQPLTDHNGEMVMDDVGVLIPAADLVKVPKMEKTKLPFYTPSLLPIVIRKNTSQEDSLFGQSDCQFIRPQQQGINKLESRITEKLIKAGVKYTYPKGKERPTYTNGIFDDGIPVEQGDINLYKTIDTQVNVQQDIVESDRMYDHAKRILGISDSFQGQRDATAQSGVAKQLQIQQSAGRLDSKKKMKNAAYAEMDNIIFQLYLAYADEPRPATFRDAMGILQNVAFNRYDFIRKDNSGEYYYDDGFMFSCDATIDIEKSRETLWQENRQNFQSGAYGLQQDPHTLLVFWLNMEKAHYPYAHDNVERIRDEITRQNQMQALQDQYSADVAGMQGEIDKHGQYEEYLKAQIGGDAQ